MVTIQGLLPKAIEVMAGRLSDYGEREVTLSEKQCGGP